MFDNQSDNPIDTSAIGNMVRVGTVNQVDESRRMVRVHYSDTNTISGWLYVVGLPHTASTTVSVTVTPSASSGSAGDPSHSHSVTVNAPATATATTTVGHILPRLNSRVLVLYLPIFGGDGFVLGEL